MIERMKISFVSVVRKRQIKNAPALNPLFLSTFDENPANESMWVKESQQRPFREVSSLFKHSPLEMPP